MNAVPLNAHKRRETGKQKVKALRQLGKLPAVIYGGGNEPEALELNYREFDAFIREHQGETVLIDLKVGRSKPRKAILRDVQRDAIRDRLLHADFQQISLTDRLTATVQVALVGRAPGTASEFGGILEQLLREMVIQCLAMDIPEHIEVDISGLYIGDSIHVRDLSFPGIVIVTDKDAVVAAVVAPMREEEVEPAEEEELEEPEVIGRAKEEESERDEES